MAASKEKVDIKRSDQFQEVDEELTRAMAELDSTIERVSLIFQSDSDTPALEFDASATGAQESETDEEANEATPPVKKVSQPKDAQ